MLINEKGTYRGIVVEHGVGQTKLKFPQWVAQFRALEKFDFEMQQWVNWENNPANEITGYFCLLSSKEEPIFHVADIQAAVGWDGIRLSHLAGLDLMNTGVQFGVDFHEYNNETKLQVTRVAHYDAVPTSGGVRKVGADELAEMDRKFAAAFAKGKTSAPVVCAAPAPTGMPVIPFGMAPVTATVPPITSPATPATQTPPEKSAAAKGGRKGKAGVVKQVTPAAPVILSTPASNEEIDSDGDDVDPAVEEAAAQNTVPAMPAITPPTAEVEIPKGMTKEEAWSTAYQMKAKDVSDKSFTDAFMRAFKVAGKTEAEMTSADWAAVCDSVNNECAVF